MARLTANITPTLLNEFVASYTADHIFLTALNNPALPADFRDGLALQQRIRRQTSVHCARNTNAAYGGGFSRRPGYFPWNNANPVYTYRDNMTKIVGNHTFIFGCYFAARRRTKQNTVERSGHSDFRSVVANQHGQLVCRLASRKHRELSADAISWLSIYNRYKIFEPYFQDDWRVTKKLTLEPWICASASSVRIASGTSSAFSFNQSAFSHRQHPGHFQRSGNPDNPLNGSLVGGNPFNGVVQCGGKGGTASFRERSLPHSPAPPSAQTAMPAA